MSVTHPSGSDLESMNEFYDKNILRAVTLVGVLIIKGVMIHIFGFSGARFPEILRVTATWGRNVPIKCREWRKLQFGVKVTPHEGLTGHMYLR